MDWIHLAQDRQVAGSCEYGKEPPDSIKCWEFLYLLNTRELLRKDSAPLSKFVTYVYLISRMERSA
jgi:hypothetical protein